MNGDLSLVPEIDFRALVAGTLRELRRFKLSERQRLVADWLVEMSFGLGRGKVCLGQQSWLAEGVGLACSHVGDAVGDLVLMRILQVGESPEGREYVVLADSNGWQVAPRVGLELVREVAERVAGFNGVVQLELIERVAGLTEALAVVSAEEASKPAGNGVRLGVGGGGGEREFVRRCYGVLGEVVGANDGGKWRVRFRRNRGKALRVLAAVEMDVREGRRIGEIGGHMEDVWKRFAN